MTARAVDNGGAGTSVAAMDAIRNSSRRGDAAARGERGSRSRRAVILRAGCSDESSETVTLASIARRTIPRQSAASRKQPVFGLPRDERNSNATRGAARARAVGTRDLPTRLSSSSYRRLSGRTAGAMPFGATERGRDERDPTRCARERTCLAPFSRRVSSLESAAKRRDRGTLTTPTPPRALTLTRHAPRAAPRRPAAMFATTPSAAAPAGGSRTGSTARWLVRHTSASTKSPNARPSRPPRPRTRARGVTRSPRRRGTGTRATVRKSPAKTRTTRTCSSPRRDLFANLAAPPPSFASATRAHARRRRGGGRGPGGLAFRADRGRRTESAGLDRGQKRRGAGANGGTRGGVLALPPRREGRNGARARRARRRGGEKTKKAAGGVGRLGDGLRRCAFSAGQARGGRRGGARGRRRGAESGSPGKGKKLRRGVAAGRPAGAAAGDSDSDDDGNKIGAGARGVTKKTRGRRAPPPGGAVGSAAKPRSCAAARLVGGDGVGAARVAPPRLPSGTGRSERRRFRRGGGRRRRRRRRRCRRAEQFRPPTPAPERVLAGIRGGRRRRRPGSGRAGRPGTPSRGR